MNLNQAERTAEQKSFLLSNIPSKTDREHLVKKISDLGGFHIDSKHFDESASHIICGKLSRTEKFLGACVTGKWILCPQYIEDSHQVQMWLDEEDYEFSVTDANQPELLVSAAKRWRWKNNMYSSLPFTDWQVSLCMNSKKRAGFQKILHSGGARIVPLEDRQEVQNVAFVLVDAEKFNAVPKLREDLDILCIREDYLGDYIIKDPEPDIFDYLIEQDGNNKQNAVSIVQSPYEETKNASKFKTEDIETTVEKSISNDEIRMRDKNFESVEMTPTQKGRKGKRPLAVRSSETVFPQQLPGTDEINLPTKKARKIHNYNHKMPQFSPKNLRSQQKSECSSNNPSVRLRIYEDDCSEENDRQMSLDNEKLILTSNENPKLGRVEKNLSRDYVLFPKPDLLVTCSSTLPLPGNNYSKTTASEEVQGDISKEQASSDCSVSKLQTKVLNASTSKTTALEEVPGVVSKEQTSTLQTQVLNALTSKTTSEEVPGDVSKEQTCKLQTKVLDATTSCLSSVLTEDNTQTPSRMTVNTPKSLSNTSDEAPVHVALKNSEKKYLENPSKSLDSVVNQSKREQKGNESKVCLDGITKSFNRKPVQMLLQKFGFRHSTTPNNGVKTVGSSSRVKSELSALFKIVPTPTPERVNPMKDLSNTPDTAIVIDDNSEADDLTELCNSITSEQPGPERASDKVHQYIASGEAISAGAESLDDLMEDLISLCNDIDTFVPTNSLKNKTNKPASLTNSEVCCNESAFPLVNSNSVLKTESIIGTAKNHAINDVEIEATNIAKNDSTLSSNNGVSVVQTEAKLHHSYKISDKICFPALKVLELDEKLDIETDSVQPESKIRHKCDKLRRFFPSSSSPMNAVSHFLDAASDTLIPMNLPSVDEESKTFTSQLIPQWMQVSSEMKFYVVSLEHGRPDVNQKPTKELLSELIKLLTCEDTRVRNLAFHYLMSWFEENPPTNQMSVKVYCDLFGFTTNKALMTDLLDIVISAPKFEGHLLHLDFVVAVCKANFWYHVNSEDRDSIKECLLIKWLWTNSSNKIHFNTNTTHVLEAFKSVLAFNSRNSQSVNTMATLLGLIFECLRLVGNCWNIKNFSCLTDCMISLSVNIAKKIMEAFEHGDEQSVILILQHFKNPWLQTLVIATILSNLNDFLVMETIQVNNISLKSIVTQYFFLLPPLIKKSDLQPNENPRISHSYPKVVLDKLPISQDEINKVAREIKSCRIKVNKRNGKGESKVHEAAIRNNADQLKHWLSIPGVDVNMKDNCGWTPLHEACNHGSYECAELLLNFVPNVNSVFDNNKSDMQRRVDINAKGFVSKTPLHDAVVNNHIDICKLLLKYGGSKLLKAKTDDGYTPLDLARTPEMREVLLMHESEGCQPVSSVTHMDSHLPLPCMYDKALRSGQDCLCATRKDCSWFLSLLGLLISSYMNYALIKGGNSLSDNDLAIANSMDHHTSLLQDHLKNITSSETYKTLQFQFCMLETTACECLR